MVSTELTPQTGQIQEGETGSETPVREPDGKARQRPPIGELLKELRGAKTLRQVEADTGITNAYLSNIELGMKKTGGENPVEARNLPQGTTGTPPAGGGPGGRGAAARPAGIGRRHPESLRLRGGRPQRLPVPDARRKPRPSTYSGSWSRYTSVFTGRRLL